MKSTFHARNDASSHDEALDVSDALRRLGNDAELLRDIMQIYLEDAPDLLDKIHAAVGDADSNALQRAAHSLKGLGSTLSAFEMVGAAGRLEHMGASRNLTDVAKAVTEVDQRAAELNQALERWLLQ